jgi:hypothetical protein
MNYQQVVNDLFVKFNDKTQMLYLLAFTPGLYEYK